MDLSQQSILEAVLESMGEGLVVADADGRFRVFNPMAQQLLGIGSSDIPARSGRIIFRFIGPIW